MAIPPGDVTITQSLLLSLAGILVFAASVYATGWVAKRVGVEDATYGRALWATLVKNVGAVLLVAGSLEVRAVPPFAVIPLVAGVLPVLVYLHVFPSTWSQAVRIWIAVVVVEIVAVAGLTIGSLAFGQWLDERFDLPSRFAVVTAG